MHLVQYKAMYKLYDVVFLYYLLFYLFPLLLQSNIWLKSSLDVKFGWKMQMQIDQVNH